MADWLPATGIERTLWIIIIAVVVGYLAGQWLNRQRSKRIGKWLQAGLEKLGGQVSWKWLKSISSGAEITVREARAPFRDLVVSYFLLTREFAPLWLIERLRGKRDLLSVRANLREPPAAEFDIVPAAGPLRRTLEREAASEARHWHELAAGLVLTTARPTDRALIGKAEEFVRAFGPFVERVSLRRRQPHVMVFLRITGLEAAASKDLWRALEKLVRP